MLAVLENRDLVAGAQESRGAYAAGESYLHTTTSSGVRKTTKAELDASSSRQIWMPNRSSTTAAEFISAGALPAKN